MTKKQALPSVSIITPNWNGGNEPLEFIQSIKKLHYPQKRIEIIVVDNGSTDGSPEKIAKKYPDVKLIRLKENIGYGPALNIGIKKSKGEYIFIGNDDLVLKKGSLERLATYLLENPNAGIVGGKIYFKNAPKKIASAGQRYNFFTGEIADYPNSNKEKEVMWVQGCAYLFPRSLINKIGMYDEGFAKIYFEDFDLCLRAKKTGFKVIYYPKAIFYHGQSTTMDKTSSSFKLFQWYKNKFRFILKQANLFQIFTSINLQLLVYTPYKAFVLRNKSFIPVMQSLFWNLKHIKETLQARKKQG